MWGEGEFLSRLAHGGSTDLNRALYELGRVVTGSGLTIVISDFLVPGGYQAGLRAVRQLRQEVALLQILAPDEIEPELQGDWPLPRSERVASVAVTSTPGVLPPYRHRL